MYLIFIYFFEVQLKCADPVMNSSGIRTCLTREINLFFVLNKGNINGVWIFVENFQAHKGNTYRNRGQQNTIYKEGFLCLMWNFPTDLTK